MKHRVVAPTVGESITEVSILKWAKEDGQAVKTGEVLLEIESDKATVEIVAENSGVLKVLQPAGARIPVGALIGEIDDSGTPSVSEKSTQTPVAAAPTPSKSQASGMGTPSSESLSPAVRKMVVEKGLNPQEISGTGKDGRITKGDVIQHGGSGTLTPAAAQPTQKPKTDQAGDRRVPMTHLRARIAERLVQAQHTAAILTTFNEADMSGVIALRSQHKEAFKTKHGVALGFMSFFTRACVEALKLVPEVNASIDGRDVVYHDYYDVGVAVGTERGLVVPVLRRAESMGFVDIEKRISEFAVKAKDGKLSIAEMSGGTFTISNGGVYGSLLSTPILNPPQTGILGMHKIQERPVAVNGKIEIRPMMYLALSYDHRLVDGKGAVTFLIAVKDFIEHPEKLRLEY